MRNGSKILINKDVWVEDQSLVTKLTRLYHLSAIHNIVESSFIIYTGGIMSWKVDFNWNFSDRELPDLSILLNMLEPIQLTLQPDTWLRTLDSSGIFTWKSFYSYLTNNPSCTQCKMAKAFLKTRVPLRWPVSTRSSIPMICSKSVVSTVLNLLMCSRHGKTHSHLFLHCLLAWCMDWYHEEIWPQLGGFPYGGTYVTSSLPAIEILREQNLYGGVLFSLAFGVFALLEITGFSIIGRLHPMCLSEGLFYDISLGQITWVLLRDYYFGALS